MMRASTLTFSSLLLACTGRPGIIGATLGESSGGGAGGGETTTTNAAGSSSTTDADESSTADVDEPRLDALPPPVDCDGVCGVEWYCYGSVGWGRAVTMLPDGESLFVVQGGVTPSLRIVVGSIGLQGATMLPDPPMDVVASGIAVDDDLRAALLFAGADGYRLERRSPPTYGSDWEHELSPTSGASLTITDVAAAPDGTIHVVGSTVDNAIGAASTELIARTYGADGSELSAWNEPGALAVDPQLLFDHVDGTFAVWAEVELDDDSEHHYWVRRIDGSGAVTDATDVAFAVPIVDRPGRRSDGWLAVSAAGTGLALRMMDDAFVQTGLAYDVPDTPDVIHPLRLQVVDDAAVVLVQPEPEIIRVRFYDADGVHLVERSPQEELYEDGSAAVSIVDLASDHSGHAGLLIGYASDDEAMTFCDLDFGGA